MITNPDKNEIYDILKKSKTIAVMGISEDPTKISRTIVKYLIAKGYNVVGINPAFSNADGIPVFPSLREIPFDIDIVDVFRRPDAIAQIIPDVLWKKPKVLWLQLGIRNDEAVKPLHNLGIRVIQDKCIKVEHQNYNW